MLLGPTAAGDSSAVSASWPRKSFTLSFGSSQRSLPRRAARRVASCASSEAANSGAAGLSASRSLVSDSPSSGFVFTHATPGASAGPESSSMSAGKTSRFLTRTMSPTRTSDQRTASHVALATRSRSVGWSFVLRSARWRLKSSSAFISMSTKRTNESGITVPARPSVSVIAGTVCSTPTTRK